MSRRRTAADRIVTALRIAVLVAGMALLGALWIVDVARGRS